MLIFELFFRYEPITILIKVIESLTQNSIISDKFFTIGCCSEEFSTLDFSFTFNIYASENFFPALFDNLLIFL